jgi:heterodisulfide reductase subunit C2
MDHVRPKESLNFARELQVLTGENALLCDQCGKCTPGCPSAHVMRMKPHELMGALKTGAGEEIFWSGAIWICVSCEACSIRCPQRIDILKIINGLRKISVSGKVESYNPNPAIPAFHRLFMALVSRYGRINELGLGLLSNLLMLTPFKDIDLAIPLLKKGKLKLPRSSRGVRELRNVIARVKELEKEIPSVQVTTP